jgi:hypothetical protein
MLRALVVRAVCRMRRGHIKNDGKDIEKNNQ